MDSYILRIYRRTVRGPDLLVGTLEASSGGSRYVFRNIEELWRLLEMEPLDHELFDEELDNDDK